MKACDKFLFFIFKRKNLLFYIWLLLGDCRSSRIDVPSIQIPAGLKPEPTPDLLGLPRLGSLRWENARGMGYTLPLKSQVSSADFRALFEGKYVECLPFLSHALLW